MALWNALAPAATVAQLVGADAAGLISAILHAVRTARRNRKECRSLARRVMMVADLLQLVQQGSETMRRPEVRRALDGLGGALRRAYELVESCQEHGAAYGFIMAGRQAEQFRDVQGEIDSYLLVFPVVSHIDITIRLDRIYNMLLPSGHDNSQQVPQVVPGLPTSHLELDARKKKKKRGKRDKGSSWRWAAAAAAATSAPSPAGVVGPGGVRLLLLAARSEWNRSAGGWSGWIGRGFVPGMFVLL